MTLAKLKSKTFQFLILSSAILFLASLWAKYDQYSPRILPRPDIVREQEETGEKKEEEILKPQPEHFINLLLLGVDKNGMGDLIMIASYNMISHQTALIAVSRHTYVADQDWADYEEAQNHLCYANYFGAGPDQDYHQGAAYTAGWIQHLFDIDLHGYISVNYEGLIELIDRIGGVEIYVDPAFADIKPTGSNPDGGPLPTGLQRLSGEQAYIFAGYRGAGRERIPEPGSPTEDGDRIRRNQRLLRAIVAEVRTLNLVEIIDIIKNLPKSVYTSLDVWDMVHLAPLVYKVRAEEMLTIVLPGTLEQIEHPAGLGLIPHYLHIDYERSSEIFEGLGMK